MICTAELTTTTFSPIVQAMLMLSNEMMDNTFNPFKINKYRENINIIKEFELIQQKKSKLSSANREWVVSQFNKYFEEVV